MSCLTRPSGSTESHRGRECVQRCLIKQSQGASPALAWLFRLFLFTCLLQSLPLQRSADTLQSHWRRVQYVNIQTLQKTFAARRLGKLDFTWQGAEPNIYILKKKRRPTERAKKFNDGRTFHRPRCLSNTTASLLALRYNKSGPIRRLFELRFSPCTSSRSSFC